MKQYIPLVLTVDSSIGSVVVEPAPGYALPPALQGASITIGQLTMLNPQGGAVLENSYGLRREHWSPTPGEGTKRDVRLSDLFRSSKGARER